MRKSEIEKINTLLRRALFRQNIAIENWSTDWEKGVYTISTYELDNCYSEQCTLYFKDKGSKMWRSGGYSFTKTQEKVCREILELIRSYVTTERRFKQVHDLIDYYHNIAGEMFDAMYSIEKQQKLWKIVG